MKTEFILNVPGKDLIRTYNFTKGEWSSNVTSEELIIQERSRIICSETGQLFCFGGASHGSNNRVYRIILNDKK